MEHLSGVDNVRNYPPEIIETLEQVLRAGGPASPDPKRKNFYDLEKDDRTFYIYASPVTGKVVLVATWLRPACSVELSDRAAAELSCTA